jgi:hypothetical protein
MPWNEFHPNYHGYAIGDPVFEQILAHAQERKLVVQIACAALLWAAGWRVETLLPGVYLGASGVPSLPQQEMARLIQTLEEEMHEASADLRFEYAARLRDEVADLRREMRDAG